MFVGVPYRIALVIDYIVGVSFSFFFNKRFTFQNKERVDFWMIGKMLITYLLMFVVNMLLLVYFVERLGLSKYLAQFYAVSVAAAASFLTQKFFVFRAGRVKR